VILRLTSLPLIAIALSSCGSSNTKYEYDYVAGKSAIIRGGYALIPNDAPEAVKRAVAAGNRLQGRPYIYGGGHRFLEDRGYDCSGTTSYVLYHAGLLKGPAPSGEFRHFGESGKGEWITVYATKGHVFMSVAGLRLDTGYHEGQDGPKWSYSPRPARGYTLRHPPGL
jgi:hypothetical protein